MIFDVSVTVKINILLREYMRLVLTFRRNLPPPFIMQLYVPENFPVLLSSGWRRDWGYNGRCATRLVPSVDRCFVTLATACYVVCEQGFHSGRRCTWRLAGPAMPSLHVLHIHYNIQHRNHPIETHVTLFNDVIVIHSWAPQFPVTSSVTGLRTHTATYINWRIQKGGQKWSRRFSFAKLEMNRGHVMLRCVNLF
jgi:hypothetical protein